MSLLRRIATSCCSCFDRRPDPAANREANYRPAERPKSAIKDQQPRALKQPGSNASILSNISTLPASSARPSEINPLQDLINVIDRALELNDEVTTPLLKLIRELDDEALQTIITASNGTDTTRLSDQFIRATPEAIKNHPTLALIGFALLSNPHFMLHAQPIKEKFVFIFTTPDSTNPIVRNLFTATQKLLAQRVTPTSNDGSESSPASRGSTESKPRTMLAFASAKQHQQEARSASQSSSPDQSWHYPANLTEFQRLHGDLDGDSLATQICFTLLNENLPANDRATLSASLSEHSPIQQRIGELIASTQTSNPHFMRAANSNDQAQLADLYQQYAGLVENPEQATQALMIMVALIANSNASIELATTAFRSAIGIENIHQPLANPDPNSTVEIARSFASLLIYLRHASLSSHSSSSQPSSIATTTSPKSSEKEDIEAVSPKCPHLLTRRASADLFANLTTEERIKLAEQPIPDAVDEPSGARRLHSKTSLTSVKEADET